MRPKADYNHFVLQGKYRLPVIVIEDKNMGGRSVTNDIENIVNAIGNKWNIDHADLCGFVIVYRDSVGEWTGWDHQNEEFYFVGGSNAEEAIASALAHRKNQ